MNQRTALVILITFFTLNSFASLETTKYFVGEEVIKTPDDINF